MSRKKAPLLFLVVFLGVSVFAVCQAAPSIVGKWEGTAPNGDVVNFEFRSDATMTWTVVAQDDDGGTVEARYEIDYTTTPAQLDVFEFSMAELKNSRFYAILEFIGNDKMRFCGDNTARPEEFGADTIEFKRVD